MYTIKEIVQTAQENHAEIDGEWIPARPINYKYRSFKEKLSDAWSVFTGKADAVKWKKQ